VLAIGLRNFFFVVGDIKNTIFSTVMNVFFFVSEETYQDSAGFISTVGYSRGGFEFTINN